MFTAHYSRFGFPKLKVPFLQNTPTEHAGITYLSLHCKATNADMMLKLPAVP